MKDSINKFNQSQITKTLCRQKATTIGKNKQACCLQHCPKNQSLTKIKACFGCGDDFPDYGNNYHYCADCALNGSRYIQSKCFECGNGSGWIQFPGQKLRTCKACILSQEVNHA